MARLLLLSCLCAVCSPHCRLLTSPAAMNKLKKEALKVIAANLPMDEITGLKEMFHSMDKDARCGSVAAQMTWLLIAVGYLVVCMRMCTLGCRPVAAAHGVVCRLWVLTVRLQFACEHSSSSSPNLLFNGTGV